MTIRCAASCLALSIGLFVAGAPVLAQAPCTPGNFLQTSAHYPAGAYALEVVAADFNNDGRPDFAVANLVGNSLKVWMNLVEGFVSPDGTPSIQGPGNLLAADFNEDGLVDLAVVTFQPRLRILRGNGDGTFAPLFDVPTATDPRGLTTGDFNEDGIADLAVASGGGVWVFLGQGTAGVGNGTFGAATSYGGLSPWGITTGDFNSDGILDLAAANGTHNSVSTFPGNGSAGTGDGTFGTRTDIAITGAQREIEASDVTGDGILDLVTAGQVGVTVLRGQGSGGLGNGLFVSQVHLSTMSFNGVVVADVTTDLIPDLIATHPSSLGVMLLRGTGGGNFAIGEPYQVQSGPVGIAAADFNLDGGVDVVVANTGPGSATILASTCAAPPPGPPVITGFSPPGGRVGDPIVILGAQFADATSVEFFNGVPAAILSRSFNQIETSVPAGAETGAITVVNPRGAASSLQKFFVGETPVVSDAAPRQGKRGTQVVIDGDHFTSAIRVRFGNAGQAAFTVNSDERITAVVDFEASSGPISVTTLAATGTSSFGFTVLPPDTFPRIVDVADVPNDQGGKVSITWLRSDLDGIDFHQISGYRVWRRAPNATELSAREAGLMRIESPARPDGRTRVEFWEPLVTLPAAFLDGYAYVSPTTQDSLEDSNPYTAFFIQALTTDPLVFYSSAVDSGYSVDDLSPALPAPFTAAYSSEGVALHWGASRAVDLHGYRLYRGGSAAFAPGASSHIATVPDTGYFDPAGNASSYYKLSVVDLHGNESRFALVTPNGPIAALASLVRADERPDRVHLLWDASANPGLAATLYRRGEASDWSRVRGLTADGQGRIEYEDADVAPGGRYGYRLGVVDGGIEVFAGEAWVDLPRFAVAFTSIRPNPAPSGAFAVEMTLAGAGRATLELLDVTGRLVSAREVASPSAGRHTTRFDLESGLSPGLYFLRLTQENNRVTAKVAVLP